MKKFTSLTAILFCSAWMAYGQWTYTNLSEPKGSMGSAALGNKVYFAGGDNGSEFLSEVQVYDVINKTWEIAGGGLFYARIVPGGSVACGSKVFFAGGISDTDVTDRVDIYNFTTNTWSIDSLSQARTYASAVTVGTKVIIAGGNTSLYHPTNRVDIYDASTGTWSQAELSSPRSALTQLAAFTTKTYKKQPKTRYFHLETG